MKQLRAMFGITEWPLMVQIGPPWCVWIRTPWWRFGVYRDNGWPPLFSERYGYTKHWRVFGLHFNYRPKERRSS